MHYLSQLAQNRLVIVKVDAYSSQPGIQSHWVLVTKKIASSIADPSSYSINDPWDLSYTGKTLKHYYNSSHTGATFFAMRYYSGPWLDTTPPSPPTHVSPANGSTIDTLTPTFTWNRVSNADYYGLYISEPPYGENHLVFNSREDYGHIYGTSFRLPTGKLARGLTYYWNMQAYNSEGGWGSSSTSWRFTTLDTTPPVAYMEFWDEEDKGWWHWGTLGTSLAELSLRLRGTESKNRSTTTIVRYEWDFGDGDTAQGEYVNHTYTTGNYDITLTVYDEYGASGSETLKIEVRGKYEEPINFPDPNLEQAIRDAIDKPTGDIYQSDLVGLTTLEAWSKGISDLSGLEYCTDMDYLWLGENNISDISVLSGLTNLIQLAVMYNNISDISALSGLTNLIYLALDSNNISDISVLSGLTNLIQLGLRENNISDISALSGLTSLGLLDLWKNNVSDISALSGLTNLTKLWMGGWMGGNNISDISALSGLTNLIWLYLEENDISDISALSGLTNLTELDLYDNNISDISALSGLTSLTGLSMGGNNISNISALSGLTNLTSLYLLHNGISDISALSGLTNLTILNLMDSNISNISALSGLTKLTELWLDRNDISDIQPLVDNIGLRAEDYLCISYNYLDIASGSDDMQNIQTLINRGVSVDYEPQNNIYPPAPPNLIFPYRPNGEIIASNEPAAEGTFVFKDIMIDYRGDMVKLQMELRPINESFTGVPNYESDWAKGYSDIPLTTPPGDCIWDPHYQEYVATICVNLTAGTYHWQLQAINEHSAASSWASFDNLDIPVYLIVTDVKIGDGIVTKYAFLLCSDPEGKLIASVMDMESALKTWWLVDHVKVYKWWEHNNLDLRKAMEESFKQPDPDDLAIFYYAGHGSPKLIGSNSIGELLSYQALSGWLQNNAGTTIIILDACYSGSAITAQESENLKGPGRWILTGTNDSEPGKGWDYFGGLVRYLNFTKPLLDAISWESPSIAGTDSFISLREAFTYADQKCNGRWLKERQQDPQIWPEQKDKDFIVTPQRVDPTGWWPSSFVLYLTCPVDITITDPYGNELSQDKNEIGDNAFRVDADFDGDGENDIFCRIYFPIMGEYSVQVVPLPSASPTDTFTLLASSGDSVMTIAREIQVADIPDEPYRIEITAEGIEPVGGVCSPSQLVNHGPSPVPSAGCIFWLSMPDDTSNATIKIFDIDGAELLEIHLDPTADRYPQTGRWLPQDDQGRLLGSGLYLYVVKIKHTDGTVTHSPVQKMVIQQ